MTKFYNAEQMVAVIKTRRDNLRHYAMRPFIVTGDIRVYLPLECSYSTGDDILDTYLEEGNVVEFLDSCGEGRMVFETAFGLIGDRSDVIWTKRQEGWLPSMKDGSKYELDRQIVNLTQHRATPEQVAAGVFDVDSVMLSQLLTFNTLPRTAEVKMRAKRIAEIAVASGVKFAMIGGAPYLMSWLDLELSKVDITPVYSFTERCSVEAQRPDGTVVKTSIFKHVGFYVE